YPQSPNDSTDIWRYLTELPPAMMLSLISIGQILPKDLETLRLTNPRLFNLLQDPLHRREICHALRSQLSLLRSGTGIARLLLKNVPVSLSHRSCSFSVSARCAYRIQRGGTGFDRPGELNPLAPGKKQFCSTTNDAEIVGLY